MGKVPHAVVGTQAEPLVEPCRTPPRPAEAPTIPRPHQMRLISATTRPIGWDREASNTALSFCRDARRAFSVGVHCGRQGPQPFVFAAGPSIFDRDILAFDKAPLAQPLAERPHEVGRILGRSRAEIPDDRHPRRILCPTWVIGQERRLSCPQDKKEGREEEDKERRPRVTARSLLTRGPFPAEPPEA